MGLACIVKCVGLGMVIFQSVFSVCALNYFSSYLILLYLYTCCILVVYMLYACYILVVYLLGCKGTPLTPPLLQIICPPDYVTIVGVRRGAHIMAGATSPSWVFTSSLIYLIPILFVGEEICVQGSRCWLASNYKPIV